MNRLANVLNNMKSDYEHRLYESTNAESTSKQHLCRLSLEVLKKTHNDAKLDQAFPDGMKLAVISGIMGIRKLQRKYTEGEWKKTVKDEFGSKEQMFDSIFVRKRIERMSISDILYLNSLNCNVGYKEAYYYVLTHNMKLLTGNAVSSPLKAKRVS